MIYCPKLNHRVYILNNVFITAISSISSLGVGVDDSTKELFLETPKIYHPKKGDKFNKPYCPVKMDYKTEYTKCSEISLKLLEHIEPIWINNNNLPIFYSTSTGGIKETEEVYTDLIKHNKKYPLHKKGYFYDLYMAVKQKYNDKISEVYTFTTACSSAGHAILQAYRFIKEGIIDKALVIGVDSLSITTMIGFDSLKLISPNGTQPLTTVRDGLTLGEGGGILFLESQPNTPPIAEILGCHSNTDGYHITAPNPQGIQQKECIQKALIESNIPIEHIDYINAHGTGTPLNDEVELNVIKEIFKSPVPVSSLKSFIGHTLGSSAITEIALLCHSLKTNKIIQPNNMGQSMDSNYIPQKTIQKKVKIFIKNSFGFGGNNFSAVIKLFDSGENIR